MTISVYTMNKLTDVREDLINSPIVASSTQQNQRAIMLGVISTYCIALLCAYLCNLYEVGVILLPLCAGVLYSIKLFGFRLKEVLVMKNALIAGLSACLAVLIPLASHPEVIGLPEIHFSSFAFSLLLLAYFIFFKVFINTILFDVRDMRGDRLADIVTIPVLLGKAKTRRVLLALNCTFVPWLLLAAFEGLPLMYILVLGVSVFYGYWYILRICQDGDLPRNFFHLTVDGEWIYIAGVLALLVTTPINLALTWHL